MDGAVQAFASTGKGFLRCVDTETGAAEHRLYVAGAWARVALTPTVLHVIRLHRSATLR